MSKTTMSEYRGYQIAPRRNGVGREYLNLYRDGHRIAHADTITEAHQLIDSYVVNNSVGHSYMVKFRVFYMRPECFGTFIGGDALPDIDNLGKTHIELRVVEAEGLDALYSLQQAHNWGEDWRATNALLEQKGLRHTSMSVGDVAENITTGEFFVVANVGFTQL